jgi:hypothetical protein
MTNTSSYKTTSMANFAGTYYDVGYGFLTVCATSSTSGSCASVLDDYAASTGSLDDDTLYASWPRLWSTHVTLMRMNDAEHFTLFPYALFPHGYGNNKTGFATIGGEMAHARFGVSADGRIEGLGVIWEEGTEREHEGKTPKERAEVWFVKQ